MLFLDVLAGIAEVVEAAFQDNRRARACRAGIRRCARLPRWRACSLASSQSSTSKSPRPIQVIATRSESSSSFQRFEHPHDLGIGRVGRGGPPARRSRRHPSDPSRNPVIRDRPSRRTPAPSRSGSRPSPDPPPARPPALVRLVLLAAMPPSVWFRSLNDPVPGARFQRPRSPNRRHCGGSLLVKRRAGRCRCIVAIPNLEAGRHSMPDTPILDFAADRGNRRDLSGVRRGRSIPRKQKIEIVRWPALGLAPGRSRTAATRRHHRGHLRLPMGRRTSSRPRTMRSAATMCSAGAACRARPRSAVRPSAGIAR